MKSTGKILLLAASTLLLNNTAQAEAPMNVDDAGTLAVGGMKVEGVWRKDDQTRGPEMAFGFSPLNNVEVQISGSQSRDSSASPATKSRGLGIGLKWVPVQNETGWSFGASFAHGQTRVNDQETPEKFTERDYAINGLASWRNAAGHVVHLNLGSTRVKAQGASDSVATWGAGYEYPLAEKLKLTAEVFGEQHARPDKAIGLRYEIFEGGKLSVAVGRGSERSFGQFGFAWEF